MILLETERLILRNWRDGDQAVVHRLNSDETIMKYFPFRRDRTQSNQFMAKIKQSIAKLGYGWTAVELRESGNIAGFTGIADFDSGLPFAPAIEIGWRFLPEFWGKGYATEAARVWLEFGFTKLELDEIISFAVPQNSASTAVMERIGMRHYPKMDFNHPSVSNNYAHLKRHVYYALTRQEFLSNRIAL